ncbi:ATP-dependent metallopeptidase Hfl [Thelephora ganbajun]|uniref:ATP-dependent metallopeptidase Hfl n=1 Tax=Thelephora ganbajun TaxID=370292 RepID=A0ACB6ZU29_THEGA|nr:ATP-dependent metallopeptidase Hfl [Thelephora ganbajun]
MRRPPTHRSESRVPPSPSIPRSVHCDWSRMQANDLQDRTFSNSQSITPTPRTKPTPTPSPSTVADISLLEAAANIDHNDVDKQIALYEALLATKVKAGYDTIISRWERLSEFDSPSPVLRSDRAFELYLSALVKNGLEASVNAAVRRRDTILASSATPATPSADALLQAAVLPVTSTPDLGIKPEDTRPPPSSLYPTRSESVARKVLSGGGSFSGSVGNGLPKSDQLAAAITGGAGGSGNPIYVTLAEPKGTWAYRSIKYVASLCAVVFIVVTLLSVMLDNTGFIKAGPKQSEFEPQPGKTVKFSDVQGVDEAKEELQDVVEFLKDPAAFASLGGKLPKGVLLTGPPGTGKTMLARAVAGEAGVPFLFASGAEFDEMFVGVGAKRVRDLFAAARKKQPAIIFIDELDAIGGKRSQRDQHYLKQTLNQLLVEMDGFLQDEGVIVVAATNFPESLDQALVRPGRFDRVIAVPLPDVRGRNQILQHHMKEVVTAPDVDSSVLARGTPGFSGADLHNMVNQAAIQASKEGSKSVTLKHFEWAKDRIVMGAERKSFYIDDKVKLMTAYHEGGHALVALYTDGAMPLHKVTCVPRGHALGITSQLPKDDRISISFREYLAEIDVCMGGRVAEELIYGPQNVTSGASSDLRHATNTANAMVKLWGYSEKVGPVYHNDRDDNMSSKKREEIESEVRSILKGGEKRATDLLKEKEGELHRLARALVEYETLDLEEVKKVIQGEPIRSIKEVLDADKAEMERGAEDGNMASPSTPLPKVGQQQTATRARGV